MKAAIAVDVTEAVQCLMQLGANNPNLQPNTNLWGSPLYSNLSELDSAHQEGVKRLLHKRYALLHCWQSTIIFWGVICFISSPGCLSADF